MKVDVVAITSTDEEVIKKTTKEDLELAGGYSANICYTQKEWKEIVKEDYQRTKNRIEGNKANNHHSVFGHTHISLYISGVPKLLAMLLNNEHEYNTSEKSARYTKMMPTQEELAIYEKWVTILEQEIKKAYPNEKYLNDQGILYKTLSRRWWKILCLQDAIRRSKRDYKMPWYKAYGKMRDSQ